MHACHVSRDPPAGARLVQTVQLWLSTQLSSAGWCQWRLFQWHCCCLGALTPFWNRFRFRGRTNGTACLRGSHTCTQRASCNPLGCPPPLSPTARESPAPTQSPRLVTVRISCVSCRIAFCSPMSPLHTAVQTHTLGRPLRPLAPPRRRVRRRRSPSTYALREPGGGDFTSLESYGRQCSATHKLNLTEPSWATGL